MGLANSATVFLLEQDADIINTMRELCNEKSLLLECFSSISELRGAVARSTPHCIVATNDPEGNHTIRWTESLEKSIPVIILSQHNDVHTAVASIKAGAMDCVEKPIIYGRLAEHFDAINRQCDSLGS